MSESRLSHRQVMVVLSGLLLAMFLAALDQTVVAIAMKTIADKLNAQTTQAWATTAYLVTAMVGTPLYGKLSDSYGRKKPYLVAIAIFVVGSLLCVTAQSIWTLALWRAVQGAGAGALLSLPFAILGDLVSPRERGRYQAYFLSIFAASSVLGPIVGGLLAAQPSLLGLDGWRWIFLVNVPVGLVAFAVILRVLRLPYVATKRRLDLIGALMMTGGVVALLVFAQRGKEFGWLSPKSLGLLAGGLGLFVLFVFQEKEMGEDAILPLRCFRNPVFRIGAVVSFLVGAGMFGTIAVLPLYLQVVRGQSPIRGGFALLPLMLGMMTASGVSGQFMVRTGRYKVYPIAGSAVLAVALALLATLRVDTSMWVASGSMVLVGVGLGLCLQTLVVAIQNAMPPEDMGVATGSASFFRSFGATFGTAVYLTILFHVAPKSMTHRATDLHTKDPTALDHAIEQITRDQSEKLRDMSLAGAPKLNDLSFLNGLSEPLRGLIRAGFADGMHVAFLVGAALMVPAIVFAFRLKELPLRTTVSAPPADEAQLQES